MAAKLQEIGLERGWGATVGSTLDTIHLLGELLQARLETLSGFRPDHRGLCWCSLVWETPWAPRWTPSTCWASCCRRAWKPVRVQAWSSWLVLVFWPPCDPGLPGRAAAGSP